MGDGVEESVEETCRFTIVGTVVAAAARVGKSSGLGGDLTQATKPRINDRRSRYRIANLQRKAATSFILFREDYTHLANGHGIHSPQIHRLYIGATLNAATVFAEGCAKPNY